MSASERRISELEQEITRLRHLLAAQFPTAEARDLAYNILRVSEWAEVDSQMLTALREAGFDDQTAGGFMALMRESRGGHRDRSAA